MEPFKCWSYSCKTHKLGTSFKMRTLLFVLRPKHFEYEFNISPYYKCI